MTARDRVRLPSAAVCTWPTVARTAAVERRMNVSTWVRPSWMYRETLWFWGPPQPRSLVLILQILIGSGMT